MKIIQSFKSLFFVTALGSLLVMSSCNKDDDPIVAPPTPTVVGVAQSDTTFSILVAAVVKANLATTLSDVSKSYTVFAPTNNAFRAAGYTEASINALSAADVTNVLTPLLLYHVLGSKVLAASVPTSDTVKTLNTKNLYASKGANGVFVNGIKVVTADINASNGVVHVIDKVLVPPTQSIAQVVIANASAPTPEFSLLLAAVSRAGLAGVLSGPGKFTVFAPTNAAFSALGAPYNNASTIATADSATVRRIILSHVLPTNAFASDLVINGTLNTANPLAVISPQQTLTVTGATALKITGSTATPSNIITTPAPLFNIVTTNGVIHVIDKVLL
ncbi:fasciclin domain-containing protein [Ferruginibacter yonginensis]|uniref:Fasciclin domain-containing protein n=1 Tax=Ferruginibacter yonginensis TaxID=1310416 RepID=A0ABV8QSK6_9BACT